MCFLFEKKIFLELTQARDRRTPRPAVARARCTGSSAGGGSARSCGHFARRTQAVCRAGWVGHRALPAVRPQPGAARPRRLVPRPPCRELRGARRRKHLRLPRGRGAWLHWSRPWKRAVPSARLMRASPPPRTPLTLPRDASRGNGTRNSFPARRTVQTCPPQCKDFSAFLPGSLLLLTCTAW